jgi:hypothetical protein
MDTSERRIFIRVYSRPFVVLEIGNSPEQPPMDTNGHKRKANLYSCLFASIRGFRESLFVSIRGSRLCRRF